MDSHSEQEPVAAEAASQPQTRPDLPPFGTYGGLAPMYLSPFAIETNVSRIAQQIALGREATYD